MQPKTIAESGEPIKLLIMANWSPMTNIINRGAVTRELFVGVPCYGGMVSCLTVNGLLTTQVSLTNGRVYKRFGILKKDSIAIDLWSVTNIELKKAPITLHVEGCPILRRSRWRKLRVLTGPLTSAQIAVLPDRRYQTCGRCKPEADVAMRAWIERAKWGHGPAR